MRVEKPMGAAGTTPIEIKSLSRIYQMISRGTTIGDTTRQDAPLSHGWI